MDIPRFYQHDTKLAWYEKWLCVCLCVCYKLVLYQNSSL